MAIGGIAPLLIFTIAPDEPNAVANTLNGIPAAVTNFIASTGIPIPIYLDENFTNIMVNGEDKNLNFDTQQIQDQKGASQIKQRGIQSDVTINLEAKNTSLVLTAILALAEQCFTKAVSKKYTVSYFNGATVLIGGLMQGFNTHVDPDKELTTIQITLTKKHDDTGISVFPTIQKATGAVPLTGSFSSLGGVA